MIRRVFARAEDGSPPSVGPAESRKNSESAHAPERLGESTPAKKFGSFAALQAVELRESLRAGPRPLRGGHSPASSAGSHAIALSSLSGRERLRQVDLELELARAGAELSSLRGQLAEAQTRRAELAALRAQNEQFAAEKRALRAGLQSAEEAVAAARAQAEQERARSARLEQNLRDAMEKGGAALRLDRGGQRVISAEEHHALTAAEEAHRRAAALEKERDRLALDGFELRRAAGRPVVAEELDEELLALRVKGALQTAELEAARQRQRAALLEQELRLVRAELDVLRGPSGAEGAAYAALVERHAGEALRLRRDNETLAAAVWRLQKEQQGLLLSTLDVSDPAELKRMVVFLRGENKRATAQRDRLAAAARAPPAEDALSLRAENDALRAQIAELHSRARGVERAKPAAPPAEPRASSLKQSLVRGLRRLL